VGSEDRGGGGGSGELGDGQEHGDGSAGAGIDVTDPAELDAYVRQYNERLDEETGEEEDVFDPYERQEPIVRETPKIGRNDPCPCGSGKKYKKCCGK
jgi:hypothetical protein